MKILSSKDKIVFDKKCAVVLGDFDGVHVGHQKLISECTEYCTKNNLYSCVYTFVNSAKYQLSTVSGLLSTDEEKMQILSQCQIDFVYNECFENVKNMTPKMFCEYLYKKFNCACVFCGENFKFGKGASANPELLEKLMQNYDCKTVVLPLVLHDGHTVSSTYVRKLIQSGHIDKANKLLGYPYFIFSDVIHGNSLGHTFGYPTVNQVLQKEKIIPAFGVYASKIEIDEKVFNGVTNIGVKPTVSKGNFTPTCETFILDFNRQIYGKSVKLHLYKKLRDEKKFESIDQLCSEISENVRQTLEYFKGENLL